MKRILLFAAMASVMLSACTRIESEKAPSSGPGEINFDVYSARPTKAAIVDLTALQNSGFYALALYNNGSSTSVYFGETQVTWDKTQTPNRFVCGRYWPSGFGDGHTMTFYAVNTTGLEYVSGNTSFTYDSSAQTDVVVAQKAVIGSIPSETVDGTAINGCSKLDFSHALTKVNFSIGGVDSNLSYEVTSISLTAMKKGTYTFGSSTVWTIDEDAATAAFTYDLSNYMVGTEPHTEATKVEVPVGKQADVMGNLMLIPQDGDELNNLYGMISYTIKDGETVIKSFDNQPFTIPTSITTPTTASWGPNKSFRYVMKLPLTDLVPITFVATVEGWDPTEYTASVNSI